MAELCHDNLFEIRKYLDDNDFCNSLLVCKLWYYKSYKERKRRIINKLEPNILRHGFRKRCMRILKHKTLQGQHLPVLGICEYYNEKKVFYCPYAVNSLMDETIIIVDSPWINVNKTYNIKRFLPNEYEIDFDSSFDNPEYEIYLIAKILNDTLIIKKHREHNKFLIVIEYQPYFCILDTDNNYVNNIEQLLDNDKFPQDEIWELADMDKVYFDECVMNKGFNFYSSISLFSQ